MTFPLDVFVFVGISLFPVEKEKGESHHDCCGKGGKDGPAVELLLGPRPHLGVLVHCIVPMLHMMLLVVQVRRRALASLHIWVDLARPWTSLH